MASGATHLLKSAFGRAARFCGVSIVEGRTQFTLTFDALSSSASDSLSRRTELLDALDQGDLGLGGRCSVLFLSALRPGFAAQTVK